MQDRAELPDESRALFDALEPLAHSLADGAAIDWEAAESSELTASHKALLRQLRAIAQISSAHQRFARDTNVLINPATALETGRTIVDPAAEGEPRTWGQLILRSYIGRGSFGDVYRAWDPRLDREVALKLLTPPATGDPARSSNVISEGRALARVRHPNVVTVYGADNIAGRVGVWMELVEGRTLAQRIAADGPLAPSEAAAIGADLARALGAVHKAGLLHRDVKAQNVMCEAGGRIVLTDFGTAVAHEERAPADGDGVFEDALAVDSPPGTITPRRATLAGTPLYLAPEVLDGAAQTARSDIYALGVLLFHVLTGTFPVTGRTFREVRERHRQGRRMSLSEARSDVPPALVSVVDHALAPDPAGRSQTAEEIAATLDAVRRDAEAVPTAVRSRRARWVAAAIAVATLGVAAWLGGVVPFGRTGSVAAKEPDLVLVASFENPSGDARAQLVERTAREAVTSTRGFVVATPDRVNKVRGYMRRAPDSALDATSAREAALRDGGIRAVITGSISGPADRPTVEVRIVAPASGETVATIREAAAGGEMARMLDAVRAGIAGALDAQREALPTPIAQYEHVTTASFEALRTYTQGRAEFEKGNGPGAAAELFLRATKIDPDFALAYTWLGWCRFNSSRGRVGVEEFAKGDELAQAASPEERLWARGSHLIGLRDAEGAKAAYWDLLQLDPLHFWALNNIDSLQWDDLREYEWVISFWEQQAAARPDDLRTLIQTASALMNFEPHAGRAWPYFDRFLEKARKLPDGRGTGVRIAYALLAPAWDAWARGDVRLAAARMGRVCDAPAGGPMTVQTLHEACIRLSVALGQLQRADSHVPGDWDQSYIAIYRGDREKLTRLYESSPELRILIGPLIGSIDDGGADYADLVRGPSPASLQRFAERWRMVPSRGFQRLRIAEAFAEALVRVGDQDRAIEVLQTATSDRRALLGPQQAQHWVWARNAHAELLRRLGRNAEAELVERDLLSMLSEADADHVIAARLRERHGGPAPRGTY